MCFFALVFILSIHSMQVKELTGRGSVAARQTQMPKVFIGEPLLRWQRFILLFREGKPAAGRREEGGEGGSDHRQLLGSIRLQVVSTVDVLSQSKIKFLYTGWFFLLFHPKND